MVKLRHAVCADFLNRRVKISFRKAVRFRFRHFIFRGTLIVHPVHPFHDLIQNFLFAGIVLIQSRFRKSQLPAISFIDVPK